MKKLLTILCLGIALALPAGCKTTSSPERIAFKSTSTVVMSVDVSMKAWGQYVLSERVRLANDPAGMAALANKEAQVREAFGKYQEVARAIVLTEIGATSTNSIPIRVATALAAASGPLFAVIAELTK